MPSTNTVVEHDYWRAGVPGVAFRAGSMYLADPAMGDEAAFEALLGQIRAAIDTALRDVLTAEPDRMVMGMSAETFWGGYSGVFLDPDGHPWEIAHNPHWTITDDGGVKLA